MKIYIEKKPANAAGLKPYNMGTFENPKIIWVEKSYLYNNHMAGIYLPRPMVDKNIIITGYKDSVSREGYPQKQVLFQVVFYNIEPDKIEMKDSFVHHYDVNNQKNQYQKTTWKISTPYYRGESLSRGDDLEEREVSKGPYIDLPEPIVKNKPEDEFIEGKDCFLRYTYRIEAEYDKTTGENLRFVYKKNNDPNRLTEEALWAFQHKDEWIEQRAKILKEKFEETMKDYISKTFSEKIKCWRHLKNERTMILLDGGTCFEYTDTPSPKYFRTDYFGKFYGSNKEIMDRIVKNYYYPLCPESISGEEKFKNLASSEYEKEKIYSFSHIRSVSDHSLGVPQMGGAYAEDAGIYGWDLD